MRSPPHPTVLYLGRNQYFPMALEAALKLKEISYIHAEGYAAGENSNTARSRLWRRACRCRHRAARRPVRQDPLLHPAVASRGAHVIAITDPEGAKALKGEAGPPHHTARRRAADQPATDCRRHTVALPIMWQSTRAPMSISPRNLAKSVTRRIASFTGDFPDALQTGPQGRPAPVAGLGTRVLPATKVMAERNAASVRPASHSLCGGRGPRGGGIEHFVFVTGRNKAAIEDYFDSAFELEAHAGSQGQDGASGRIARRPARARCMQLRTPAGPAGPWPCRVWCARDIVGDEPFAVLLPDMLMRSPVPFLAAMNRAYGERRRQLSSRWKKCRWTRVRLLRHYRARWRRRAISSR